jgi:hypothetical protein
LGVVLKGEALMCKHALAGRLAVALKMAKRRTVADTEFQAILCYEELAARVGSAL